MDYLSKGEVLTNTDLDRKSLRSLRSAHEKWGQKQKCCVYHFVQYRMISEGSCVTEDWSTFTFTFSHLADAFIQSDL